MSVFSRLFRTPPQGAGETNSQAPRSLRQGDSEENTKVPRRHKGGFRRFFDHVKTTGFEPKTVIDVEIAEGTEGLYTSFPNAHFIMLEPLSEYMPVLEELSEQYNAEYALAAVGPQPGTTRILIDDQSCSSASIMKVWDNAWKPDDKKQENGRNQVRDVPMIALDDLLETHSIEPPIVLKLDIQGAELLALEGARELLPQCDIVILETSLFRFGGRSPKVHDVVDFMKKRNFVVYDVLGGSYRKLDNALGQFDLVFVQGDGFFRQSHKW